MLLLFHWFVLVGATYVHNIKTMVNNFCPQKMLQSDIQNLIIYRVSHCETSISINSQACKFNNDRNVQVEFSLKC